MGKALKARELGVGICQRKDGLHTAGFVSKRTEKTVQRYFPKVQEILKNPVTKAVKYNIKKALKIV